MRVRRSHLVPVLLTAALALLISCGSSSSEGSGATAADGGAAETSAPATSSGEDGGSDSGSGAGGSFCDIAAELDQADAFFEQDTTDSSPETALRSMQENYGKLVAAMEALESAAPAAVRSDLATVADAARTANEAIQGAQTYDELEAVMQEVFGAENEEADAASERLDQFLSDECGLAFE